MTNKKMLQALNARKKEMAAVRDKLRELLDEIESEYERLNVAYESIEYAVDRLSESV